MPVANICFSCGDSNVKQADLKGEEFTYNGVKLTLSSSIVVRKCLSCGDFWADETTTKELDSSLRRDFKIHNNVVNSRPHKKLGRGVVPWSVQQALVPKTP